ncbi:MAG: hypothetical protein Q7J80_12465 [Anaerolineales bacterium]|nr:hypothetical protein [Anaerolineales bacterium]
MKRIDRSTIAGILLILLGGMFLLEQQGILRSVSDAFFGVAFLVGGGAFLATYRSGSWWAATLAKMHWAYYPAAALRMCGALLLLSVGGLMNYVSAVLSIGAGGYLLYGYFRPTPMM